MSVWRCLNAVILLLAAATLAARVAPARVTQPQVTARSTSLQLAFEPNRGPADPKVQYLARGAGSTLFITRSEAVIALSGPPAGGAVLRLRAAPGTGRSS